MPVQTSYPGVYVQEVPSGSRTITGVSTSTALFIGMTRLGRLGEPKRVLSFAAYERAFGSDTLISEMTDQVRQFFLNGGQQAWIVRIAQGAVAASVPLRNQTGAETVLGVAARDPGVDGNSVRVAVDYDTPSPESSFNLRVFRERIKPTGELEVVDEERFENLSMDVRDGRFVEAIVNRGSALVEVTVPAAVKADAGLDPSAQRFAGYALGGWVFDSAATATSVRDRLNALLAGAGSRRDRVQISVDGGAWVTVILPDLTSTSLATLLDSWTSIINTALTPLGSSLTADLLDVTGVGRVVRFTSARADGGSVSFKPAAANDAAVALQLGVDQGGLEVSGFARQRPAPTGFAAALGDPGAAAPLAALFALAGTAKADVATFTLTDTSGRGPHTGPVTFPTAGSFLEGTLVPSPLPGSIVGSLRNLHENLRRLGEAIAAPAASKGQWRAQLPRLGHCLVLVPTFRDSDVDPTATLSTGPAVDLGAAGRVFDRDANHRAYRLGIGAAGAYHLAGTAGSDGSKPLPDDYDDAFLAVERAVDLWNLMILPRADGQSSADRALLWGPASSFCQAERAVLLVDAPDEWTDADAVASGIGGLRAGLVKDHSAVYWPRLVIARGPVARAIDPAGSVAGLMARIDAHRGVWKAPAGIEADLRAVRGVAWPLSDGDNGIVNPLAVNAIRAFPAGVVVWGARTMDGFDNSGNDDYKYLPVRRLSLMIAESLDRGLRFAVFEPNDEPLWAQIRLAGGAFMNNLFRLGAFAGQKSSDAYFVKCDAETTTQNDINLGIVNVVVGFAPLKPAEFVIVTIQQKAGQVQV